MSLQPFPRDADYFDFSGSVGRNGDNDRADVIKAQILLSSLGEYDLPAPGAPTGWAGEPLFRAIGKVQKARGLPIDGLLLPLRNGTVGENGEGETLMSLQDLLGGRLRGQAIPTPQQVDRFFDAYARDPDAVPPYVTKEIRGGEPSPTVQTKEVREALSGPQVQLRNASMTDEAPASPPVPGQQEAMLPLAMPLLLMGAPLAIGAGEYLRQQYLKNRGEPFSRPPTMPDAPPSRPVDDTEKTGATVPPLQPPEADPLQQGRPAADKLPDGEKLIPPDTKDWISGLPPAQQPLAEGLAGIIVEAHQFGPRGSPATEQATRIVTRVCFDQLQQRPELAGKLDHVAGSYHPDTGKYQTEEWVPRQDTDADRGSEKLKGGVHVDSSFGPPDDDLKKSPYWARMQTVDFSRRAGEHDPEGRYRREKEADNRLLENMRTGVAEWARKMRPGETAAEYEAYAKIRCDRMWDKLEARLRRDGFLPAR
ncbi:MAG: peptidoglycan-binding domain-containing protein [Ferrovibrio sp.]